MFVVYKLPSLWYFVIAAQTDQVNFVSCDIAKLVNLGRFCVGSLWFSPQTIKSSADGESLFLPFESVCLLFPFLAWFLWLELQCFAKSGYPCLVPDLRRKACSLSPLSMMLIVGFFVNVLYQVKEIPFIPSSLDF